jgi:hypothetical protein
VDADGMKVMSRIARKDDGEGIWHIFLHAKVAMRGGTMGVIGK